MNFECPEMNNFSCLFANLTFAGAFFLADLADVAEFFLADLADFADRIFLFLKRLTECNEVSPCPFYSASSSKYLRVLCVKIFDHLPLLQLLSCRSRRFRR